MRPICSAFSRTARISPASRANCRPASPTEWLSPEKSTRVGTGRPSTLGLRWRLRPSSTPPATPRAPVKSDAPTFPAPPLLDEPEPLRPDCDAAREPLDAAREPRAALVRLALVDRLALERVPDRLAFELRDVAERLAPERFDAAEPLEADRLALAEPPELERPLELERFDAEDPLFELLARERDEPEDESEPLARERDEPEAPEPERDLPELLEAERDLPELLEAERDLPEPERELPEPERELPELPELELPERVPELRARDRVDPDFAEPEEPDVPEPELDPPREAFSPVSCSASGPLPLARELRLLEDVERPLVASRLDVPLSSATDMFTSLWWTYPRDLGEGLPKRVCDPGVTQR